MAKKTAPEKIPEMPQPGKQPEIKNPYTPEVPDIPGEAPVTIPDEAPLDNPPVELPEPGERL